MASKQYASLDTIDYLVGKLKTLFAAKQDALTAGDNVTIEGNVISAAGPAGMSVGTDGYVYQEVSE